MRVVREAGFGYKTLLLIDGHPEGFVEMGFQLGVMHLQRGCKGDLAIRPL